MARRERRKQPRIPVEVDVGLGPQDGDDPEPVHLGLRTRNLNARGAFLELPQPGDPPPAWATADWWIDRLLKLHVCGPPLTPGEPLECDAEVRWIDRRGPKRRVVGIGVLFLRPSEAWLEAIHEFLDSLVT